MCIAPFPVKENERQAAGLALAPPLGAPTATTARGRGEWREGQRVPAELPGAGALRPRTAGAEARRSGTPRAGRWVVRGSPLPTDILAAPARGRGCRGEVGRRGSGLSLDSPGPSRASSLGLRPRGDSWTRGTCHGVGGGALRGKEEKLAGPSAGDPEISRASRGDSLGAQIQL